MARTAAVPPDASIWRDVDARPPSTSERRLLAALGTAVAEPLLDQQLVTVLVDGVCRCGCSSVRLRTREPAVPAARVARLSGTGRDDHLAVASTARTPGGHDVDVVLHVVQPGPRARGTRPRRGRGRRCRSRDAPRPGRSDRGVSSRRRRRLRTRAGGRAAPRARPGPGAASSSARPARDQRRGGKGDEAGDDGRLRALHPPHDQGDGRGHDHGGQHTGGDTAPVALLLHDEGP